MVRFVVDDKAHANSKIRSVLADDPAALALWTVAGSWCGDQTNDGFVPDHQLPWLIPVGGEELARKLVRHGLWRRVRGGYQFHEWSADGDGTRRNLTREEVLASRQKRAEAGRKGGLARAKNADRGGNEEKPHDDEEKVLDIEDDGSPPGLWSRTADETATVHIATSDNGSSTSQASASASASASARALLSPNTSTNTNTKEELSSAEPDGFAEFWTTYPPRKNSSKSDARTAYAAALKKGANPADILAGAKVYATDRHGQDPQYTAHARTWLHGQRWEDALATPAPRERAKFAWEN